MKKLWNRESLKGFFRKGQLPTEVHFDYLIESTVNILDDGFNRTDVDGLQLSTSNKSNNIISILKEPAAEHPSWQISLKNDEAGTGLSLGSIGDEVDGKAPHVSKLFLSDNGNVGINTTEPQATLEVAGTTSSKARIGALVGKELGDGTWKEILSGQKTPQVLEVVARIDGAKGSGKYALTHAIVLIPYGKSRYRIKQTQAYFRWFWNRIELRCHGEIQNFSLQIRTRSEYKDSDGSYLNIKYHITQLWDDNFFESL